MPASGIRRTADKTQFFSKYRFADIAAVFGPPSADLIVTLHVIVRPPPPPKSGSAKAKVEPTENSCWCVIS